MMAECIGCPTRYRTRHFFNNSNTNEDIATKQTHTTDTFLFISRTTNLLLFKFRCHIFIGVRIIKEMSGSVASGTLYIFLQCYIMPSIIIIITCLVVLRVYATSWLRNRDFPIEVSSVSRIAPVLSSAFLILSLPDEHR